VVLPTPPFWFAIAMTLPMEGNFTRIGGDVPRGTSPET
jgi:hypothetical protein